MKKAEAFFIIAFLLSVFACTDENIAQDDTNIYSDTIHDIKTTDVNNDTGTNSDTYFPDVLTDTEICFIKCPENMHCENNQCVCDKNYGDCNNDESDGCESDLTSLKTCGDCNTDCSVPMLGVEEFACVSGLCEVAKCKAGRANCNGKHNDGCEVYLNDDPKNCSMCNFDCGENSICENGKCGCQTGFANCNLLLDDGCEQNISIDNDNCGACNHKCGLNAYCSNQNCLCTDGFGDCNNSNSDGCETRINEDKFNCGKCKNDCTRLANVSSVKCDTGSCVIIECQYGFGNCDNYNSNGCEANFSTDPQHCGNCSTDCGNNSICNNKICDCKVDYANCDKLWSNGCEINLSDPKTCGTTCENYISCNANAICNKHQCECQAPFANCDTFWSTGCEIDTSSDRLNCGICGKQCKDINYSGSCVNSKCAGKYSFAFSYGSTGDDSGVLLATDPSGNIIMAGNFSGQLNISGKILTPAGNTDIFIAKFNSSGLLLDAKSFGSIKDDHVQGLTLNKNGDVIITGYYEDTINFGGGILNNFGENDIFLSKFSNNLEYIWAKGFGSAEDDDGIAVTVDKDQDIILGARFSGLIDIEGNTFSSKGCTDILLIKITNNGALLWAKAFGAAPAMNGCDTISSIVTDIQQNIYITGAFQLKENFGGSDIDSKGSNDIFLASFDKDGKHIRSVGIGSPKIDVGLGLRINSKNELVLGAVYSDALKINYQELGIRGGMDILISKFDTGLNFVKAVSFGSSGDDIPVLTLDKDDNVIFTGYSKGLIRFGEEELANKGDADIILVKLNSDLNHIFSYTFGSAKYDSGLGITTDNSGNIYITGEISGAVDFGGGDVPYPEFHLTDFFIAKFLP